MQRCEFGGEGETSDSLAPSDWSPAQTGLFSEFQIDHFVMAITSLEAVVGHPPSHS